MNHEHDSGSGITVSGSGSVSVAVDQVTLILGVEVVRPDAGDAFRGAAATATAVLAILAEDGVQSRSVRTANLSLTPRYEYRDNEQHLVGYQAGQQLIVTLIGLAGLDRMLTDIATRAGEGVRIDSVALSAGDTDEAMAQARDAAYRDAIAKAGQLAALAGRALGPVVRIDERDHGAPGPIRSAAFSRSMADMPVATGDTTVQAALTAHWHFAD